jgi:hypothetical protein
MPRMSRQGISGGVEAHRAAAMLRGSRLGTETRDSDSACGTSCCLVLPGPVGVVGRGIEKGERVMVEGGRLV